MAGHRPVFNRRRSLTDRDDILDMPPPIAIRINRLGATHRALRSKMTKQLFLEQATCLYKQTAWSRETPDYFRLQDAFSSANRQSARATNPI
jgi:hypothetical protein